MGIVENYEHEICQNKTAKPVLVVISFPNYVRYVNYTEFIIIKNFRISGSM